MGAHMTPHGTPPCVPRPQQVPPFNDFVVDNFMSLFAISFNIM